MNPDEAKSTWGWMGCDREVPELSVSRWFEYAGMAPAFLLSGLTESPVLFSDFFDVLGSFRIVE